MKKNNIVYINNLAKKIKEFEKFISKDHYSYAFHNLWIVNKDQKIMLVSSDSYILMKENISNQ